MSRPASSAHRAAERQRRLRLIDRTSTEEVFEMSTPDNGGVKTLAIRLQPEVHQQLVIIASLRGTTITEEIRQAIEAHIASVKASTDLASMADGVLEEIERDAANRRAAIASLFGDGTTPAAAPKGRSRKPAADA